MIRLRRPEYQPELMPDMVNTFSRNKAFSKIKEHKPRKPKNACTVCGNDHSFKPSFLYVRTIFDDIPLIPYKTRKKARCMEVE
jgi:hypothetical protein